MTVVGVDAARQGWAVVTLRDGRVEAAEVVPAFADVVALNADVVAVAIPFVLQTDGWRVADREAKALLGRRHSTIFMTPPAAVVDCEAYDAANALCGELTGGGLSRQMYNLFVRIREVRASGARVHEVHPDLAFAALAGEPLPTKRSVEGRRSRLELLGDAGIHPPAESTHDLLDAAACALVAQRIAAGSARSLPAGGPPVLWY